MAATLTLAVLMFFAQGDAPPGEDVVSLGHADGVKIGEVTPTTAVLWTRLTRLSEASHRVDGWDPERPHWTVPGAPGEVRFVWWSEGAPGSRRSTAWASVDGSTDFCHQVALEALAAGTSYAFEAQGRPGPDSDLRSSFPGSFRTAPDPVDEAPVTLVISTCQDFPRRDDLANGHRIYRSMLALEPAFFVQTGDTLYYDKPAPFAKDIATARYKWSRLYALPNLRAFHARVPSYWMHDDHDVLKDDCWPGQSYGDLTFEQGLQVWREQIPQSTLPYRTFRWGRHLQIWLPEGREFRTPNREPDGPAKSILGEEQWRWLESSMRASDATFKLYVSATPVVGPDRRSKKDNHANEAFRHEGKRLRKWLASVPGVAVINGDRHWQYHSIDQVTGLQEFGCGPASDAHAGGFRQALQEPWQPFLRIAGGFLSVRVTAERAVVEHHDVDGRVTNSVTITAPVRVGSGR